MLTSSQVDRVTETKLGQPEFLTAQSQVTLQTQASKARGGTFVGVILVARAKGRSDG